MTIPEIDLVLVTEVFLEQQDERVPLASLYYVALNLTYYSKMQLTSNIAGAAHGRLTLVILGCVFEPRAIHTTTRD